MCACACLPVVLKLDEAEAVLEGDLPEAAEPLEELLHVALAHVVADVADVAARPRHLSRILWCCASLKESGSIVTQRKRMRITKMASGVFSVSTSHVVQWQDMSSKRELKDGNLI